LLQSSPDNNVISIYNVNPGPSIPSPNCCGSGQAGSCSLGNYPCNDNQTVQTIVPTQHYFSTSFTQFYFQVTTSTQNLDVFISDLNPAITYDLYIGQTKQTTILPSSTTQGFFYIRLTGVTSGLNTVCIQTTGATYCPTLVPPPPSPSSPNGRKSKLNSGSLICTSFLIIISNLLLFL
jgi:hypothetical protein